LFIEHNLVLNRFINSFMFDPKTITQTLRTWHRMAAGQLLGRLQISRATLMRALKTLGAEVITRGRARRTAYAARRSLRGSDQPLQIFSIDRQGRGAEVGTLDLTYPQGCALRFNEAFDWPLEGDMLDGWFEGIPYPLDDMRPQGFLGRHFARQNAQLLQVGEDPRHWSDDDVLFALSVLGADQPGNYIVGETAYRRFLAQTQQATHFLTDAQMPASYQASAQSALNLEVTGSSAGGEFPKFTAVRSIDGVPRHVIVKFSGADASPGTQRWADLLVCEHLALSVVAESLQIEAASSQIYQIAGRTFLEVQRFDRHGAFGRSPVCSWAALNDALFGLAGKTWLVGAAALRAQGLIAASTEQAIQKIWHFGQLIANTDMHDGNLAFRPGLALVPVYDMLPMLYAPPSGVELPQRTFTPALPLPTELNAWQVAAQAATQFWRRCATDARVSEPFRRICSENSEKIATFSLRLSLGETAASSL
jgi:hypothetical protein